MKRWAVTIATATLATMGYPSLAQDGAPAPPPLTAAQSQQVQSEMEAYRRETDARVARSEICVTPFDRQVFQVCDLGSGAPRRDDLMTRGD